MNDFKVVDLLYKGDVSDIWQGIHVASTTEVHVVTVNKKVNGHIFDQRRMLELEPLVSQLNHPHMLRYHKIVQNDNTIGIIMEHPKGGCLRDFLLRRPDKRLPENEARVFFKQILSAVEYVNKLNVIYRNLNLRNIFIDKNNEIKIGDFLVCTKVGPIYKPSSATSSYHFYAPEIWLEDGKKIDSAADVWSLGVLLYVMTCGCYPFDGKHEFDIFFSVKKGHFAIPSSLSDECASLIKAILHPEASKRLTLAQIRAHPWFMGTIPFPILIKRSTIPSSVRGHLGPIPETSEEEQVASPMLPLQHFRDMKIDIPASPPLTKHRREPPQARQVQHTPSIPFFNYGDPYTSFQPSLQPPMKEITDNPPRKKRPSADEGVQNLIANYFKLKQEDNANNVSSFISGSLQGELVNQDLGDFLSDTSMNRPPSKRRSSDSILQSQSDPMMRFLGYAAEDNLFVTSPFNPTPITAEKPQPAARGHARSMSNGTETKPRRVSSTSSVKAKGSKVGKRRNSLDVNITPLSGNRVQDNNSMNDFSNIFLPSTTEPKSPPHTGPIPLDVTDHSNANHFQQIQNQNLYHQLHMQQVQQQQHQRDLQQQKEQQRNLETLLSGDIFSSRENVSISQSHKTLIQVQEPPFLHPELQREIDNLSQMDVNSLDLDPFTLLASTSVDDWINSTGPF